LRRADRAADRSAGDAVDVDRGWCGGFLVLVASAVVLAAGAAVCLPDALESRRLRMDRQLGPTSCPAATFTCPTCRNGGCWIFYVGLLGVLLLDPLRQRWRWMALAGAAWVVRRDW